MFLDHTSTGRRWPDDYCRADEKYFQILRSQQLDLKEMVRIEFMNEEKDIITTSALPVMEHFYTLQGEGFHQGRAAYFIRLGGCDVGCVWCDVKESWDAEKHPKFDTQSLRFEVEKTPAEIVVITGGEPLMHDLTELTHEFQSHRLKTHLETSGAYPLTGNWDWICLSPKKFKAPLPG